MPGSIRARAATCGAALLLAASAGAAPASAAPPPAALDPAFGDGGVARMPPSGMRAALDLAATPDGGVVAVGYAEEGGRHWVVKLDAAGRPDAGFGGGDGVVTLTFDGPAGGFGSDIPRHVAVDGAGRIVVAGEWGVFGRHVLAVARLLPDGSYDPAFDGDGRTLLTFAQDARFSFADALDVAPDGTVTIAGSWRPETPSNDPHVESVVVLAPDGTQTGLPHWLFQISMAVPTAIARAADGRIAFAGDAFFRSLLVVRSPDYAPAPGFPDPFLADLSGVEDENGLRGVTFTPDGGVVAVGYARDELIRDVAVTVSLPAAGGEPRVQRFPGPDELGLWLGEVALVDGLPVAGGSVGPDRWRQVPALVPLGPDGLPDPARGGVQPVALPASIPRADPRSLAFVPGGDAFQIISVWDAEGRWSEVIARIDAAPAEPGGRRPGDPPPSRRPGDPGDPPPPERRAPGGDQQPPSQPPGRPSPAARTVFAAAGLGPVRSLRGTVAERGGRVEVALARRDGARRCRALRSTAPRFSRAGACDPSRWLPVRADRRGRWRLAFGSALPAGRYLAWVRAAPRPDRAARPFSRTAGNRVAFTVRGR